MNTYEVQIVGRHALPFCQLTPKKMLGNMPLSIDNFIHPNNYVTLKKLPKNVHITCQLLTPSAIIYFLSCLIRCCLFYLLVGICKNARIVSFFFKQRISFKFSKLFFHRYLRNDSILVAN